MRLILLALVACGWAAPARAADLTKIERTLRKEPAYSGKPKYCLLVFGAEARARAWLVLDGDTLYVDRDGDGDLTGPGEKVKLSAMKPVKEGPIQAVREVKAGSIKEGRLTHKELTLMQARLRKGFIPKSPDEKGLVGVLGGDKDGDVFAVALSVDRGGKYGRVKQSAGEDAGGVLRFAATAKDAPVVHFNGPWAMGLRAGQKIMLGDTPADLKACVGTPGLGKGTFAAVVYEGIIPEGVLPVAEVAFPAKRGGRPPTARVTLDKRC